jgi:ubiquinone/menaquinone biosynthesis C-methylase UbiE
MSADLHSDAADLQTEFGLIDIYVFDQLLRGNLHSGQSVLDAGCGPGRNAHYLMRQGAEVYGVDRDPAQIDQIQARRANIAQSLPRSNFCVAELDDLPFPDAHFGAVICNSVLHFCAHEAHFEAIVSEMWRVLEPGGLYFARLASTIGLGGAAVPVEGRWHTLPDGSERFLVDEAYLTKVSAGLGAAWVDPLKTTVVQGMRAMTTWVLRK